MSLGSISSFTLQDRAGYSCYLRAAYCSKDKAGATKIVLTDRLGNHLNLGDTEVRSLKDAGIPDGSQVQLVIEVIAASKPMRMAEEVYTYTESSFRTASYKCSGTVFNPKLERVIRRPPPPPAPAMTIPSVDEKTPLIDNKEAAGQGEEEELRRTGWATTLCCCSKA